MPRITHLQTNFTAGELSPRLYGRVDVSRYQSGAKTLRNAHPVVQGGAPKRNAWLYMGEVADHALRGRLIPFVRSVTESYALEFGDLLMRVWKVEGQVLTPSPYEIVTPYTEAMLADIDFTQSADTMLLFHEAVYPQRLVRVSDASWSIGNAPFSQLPTTEGTTPATTVTPSAVGPEGATITLTLGANGWVVGDVGNLVRVNGGLVRITAYTSPTVVDGKVVRVLNATTAAEVDSWALEVPAWSVSRGYPRTGTFHDQRLEVAGTPSDPLTVWGSAPGLPFDFTIGTADDDAFAFEISADQMNPIRYVSAMRVLAVLSFGGEFTIQGGIEKPITPTNVQVRQRANHGCAGVRPVRIGREEMFVQRGGRKVLAFAYNVSNDDFEASDLTVLAEHLTQAGIVDMAWQQEPNRLLWVVLADGRFLSLTIDREQQVLGWAQHLTDGQVESVCSIPSETRDEVFAIVRREINGQQVRYVERLVEGLFVDCALMAETTPAQAVWTGLDHLEGKTVKVWADGVAQGSYTVAGGQITLTREALSVQVGLPFTVEIELLTPEMQTGMGSAAGNNMTTNEVTLRVLETSQCKVNGQTITFRQMGSQLLDQPVPIRTGIDRVESLGRDRGDSPITITHDEPLPFHMLSVTRKLTVND